MKLTGLLPLEKWIEFEKDIHERTGLASNVFDIEGFRITGYKVWVNRLCPVIKADDRGQSFICAVAHMNYAGMAKQSKAPVIDECDVGLLKLVVPVFVKDEFLGSVGACGLLLEDSEVDTFMVNKTIEMEEEKIERLSSDMKRIPFKKVEELSMHITERIEKIVNDYEKGLLVNSRCDSSPS
jgi:ligand-binding sensor protein